MINTLFSSIALSLGMGMFLIIIGIVYYIKDKKNNVKGKNKMFITLFITTIILSIVEVLLIMSLSRTHEPTAINNFACREFTYLCFLWNELFIGYLYTIIKKAQDKPAKPSTLAKIMIVLLNIIVLAAIAMIKVEYLPVTDTSIYAITGGLYYFTIITNLLASIISIILLAINKKIIKNVYITPIVIVFLIDLLMSVIQITTNTVINEKIAFYAIVIIILYLTIESQDNKLLHEYSKSKDIAESANKAKTEFLINMSREIRTPMSTILGFSETLLAEETLNEEIAKKDIKSISEASNTLLDLINNILDISKLESGEVALNESDYLLEGLVFELNSLIPSKITKEELKFTIDINNEIPREYHGDAYKIFKVVTYVLMNAIEHTNYGEVKLTINGEKLNDNEMELILLVSNTGHDMLAENFAENFDDYVTKENKNANNSFDTIKIGLMIAKQLIEILGGKIEFVNKTGEGTKYYIKIKQKIVNPEKIGNIFESKDGTISSSKDIKNYAGLKALVVDDSDINIKLAVRYLQQFNFTISTATNGKDCINLVKENDYNIILIDHMMPDMDGVATVAELQKLGKQLPPIVALTANNYEGIKDEFIKKGFKDYLQKPLNFKALNRLLNALFENKN